MQYVGEMGKSMTSLSQCPSTSAHSTVGINGHSLIEYKIAAITYKAKHFDLPVYLHDLPHEYQPTRTAFINRQQAAASSTHHFVRWQVVLDCSTHHLELSVAIN